MSSQSALQVVEIGKPLIKVTRPIPIPGEGEVVVKVTSAGSKLGIYSSLFLEIRNSNTETTRAKQLTLTTKNSATMAYGAPNRHSSSPTTVCILSLTPLSFPNQSYLDFKLNLRL